MVPYYYSKPEGQDIGTKIKSVLKYTLPISFYAGLTHAYGRPEPLTMPVRLLKIAHWMVPLNAAGIIYPSVAYVATRMRGKDDALNHGLAGLALIPIIKSAVNPPFNILYNVSAIIVTVAVLQKGFRKGIPELQQAPKTMLTTEIHY